MVASHNENTVRFAIDKMEEIGISPEDKVICFGQLLGMCDYITFPLGKNNQKKNKIKNQKLIIFFFFLIQVKPDIQLTNTYLMVQLMKSFHICQDEHRKIKEFYKKLRKKRVYYSKRLEVD